MTNKENDVFISYTHDDKEYVVKIVEALRAKKLKVWFDDKEVKDYEGIMRHLTNGLSRSKALVAYYSTKYPKSRFCQWEFTSAFIAGQLVGDPINRIMVLNPEQSHDHIMPSEFQGALFKRVPKNPDDAVLDEIAESVKERVSDIDSTLVHISTFDKPLWYGRNGIFYSNFVGRLEDMWNIHTKLNSYETILITGGTAQVQGMGGIGKSLLVEEYAMRYGSAYPGGIYWLSASQADPDNPDSELERQLNNIALELGIRNEAFETNKSEDRLPLILGSIKHYFESRKKTFLWIVDDVPIGMDSEKLRTWFAPHQNGKTLITTKSTEYKFAECITLDVLTQEDAYTLITSRKQPKDKMEERAALEIIEMLGYHALALDVASSALEFQSYSEFLQGLKNPDDDELELAAKLTGQLPNGHEPSIATTLLRSIKLLSEDGREFLRIASILASAPIPSKLIQKVFEIHYDISESEARKRVLEALNEVKSHSLTKSIEGGDAWEVHTLISRTMRYYDKEEALNDNKNRIYSAAVKALLLRIQNKVQDLRNHNQVKHEIIHATKLVHSISTVEEARLVHSVAEYHLHRGNYYTAETLYQQEMDTLISMFGNDHKYTLASMNNLAQVFKHRGKIQEAKDLQDKVFSLTKKIMGEEHPNTITSMGNLASTYLAFSEIEKAQELSESAFMICKKALGNEHLLTLNCMDTLSEIYRIQGKYHQARELNEQIMNKRKEILGEDHSDTLDSMNNLAEILISLGSLKEAKKLHEHVYMVRKRILGKEHPDTLNSMNNLADVLRTENHIDEASELQNKVLAVRSRTLGPHHPQTLNSVNNLAEIYRDKGRLKDARELQEELLKMRIQKQGREHHDTITAMNNLAGTLIADNDVNSAVKLQVEVLYLRTKKLGIQHTATSAAAWNLFRSFYQLGDVNSSRSIITQYLIWLSKTNPDKLSADQNYIRERIIEITNT